MKTAGSGSEALQILPDEPVDVIVSNIGLPGMDGYELMRRIRANARWTALPSVALTGHDKERDIRTARDAGFDVHLAKPLDFQQLLDTLGAVILGQGTDSGS